MGNYDRHDPRGPAEAFFQVAARNGRCVLRPLHRAPRSVQEIELERHLRAQQAPCAASYSA